MCLNDFLEFQELVITILIIGCVFILGCLIVTFKDYRESKAFNKANSNPKYKKDVK